MERGRLGRSGAAVARALDRAGVIREPRLRATVDLAWPRIVTGFAIMSKRTVDLALVGWAVGATAVAGLTLANAYWMAAKFVAIGLAGGTISLVSQAYGAEDDDRAALVVETSLVLAVLLAVPTVAAFLAVPDRLIGLLGAGDAATGHGATYLAVVAPGLLFEFLNLIASRTYAGVGDTRTPMVVRAGGAALNVALSVLLVFGAGLGVVGAALGTTLSTAAVAAVFAWGMSGRSYFGRGASPISPTRSGPHVDRGLVRDLARVSAPLVGKRLAGGLVVFPLLAIAALFGDVAVAAVGVARQVRALLNSFNWGFSIAASTLVGQRLGAEDESEAEAYGREIVRLSGLVYAVSAVLVAVFAVPVARLFGEGGADPTTVTLVRAAGLSLVPLGISGSVDGALRGAGDTRVPFLASLVGFYVVGLPVAYLGTLTPLSVTALALSLVASAVVPAAVNLWWFRGGHWKAVSRELRASAGD
ncbi:MATE family efflux transporter [Halobacteriales archaeon SW_5_70_135]|nr:MAG: MATE family efflux transporter [Halobacteriales archaeon SW_5_70_135]